MPWDRVVCALSFARADRPYARTYVVYRVASVDRRARYLHRARGGGVSMKAVGGGPAPLDGHAVPGISRELSFVSHLSFPQVERPSSKMGLPARRGNAQ